MCDAEMTGMSRAFIASLTYAGVATGAGVPYFIVTVAFTSVELIWQMVVLDFNDGQQCWSAFKVRILYLYIRASLF